MRDDPQTRFRENITEITATLVTGLWLVLLFSGIGGSLWLITLLVGYVVVVPLVALLFGDESDRKEWWEWGDGWEQETDSSESQREMSQDTKDALETLRTRYARGELTDEQFEAKLERLLEVETLEDAQAWKRRQRDDSRDSDRSLEYET